VSYAVLPALLVALVVGELLADELVDLGQGEPLHGRALDGHADQRHVRVGRLLQVRTAVAAVAEGGGRRLGVVVGVVFAGFRVADCVGLDVVVVGCFEALTGRR